MRRGEILALERSNIDGRVATIGRKHPTEHDRIERVPLLKAHPIWPKVDPLEIFERQPKRQRVFKVARIGYLRRTSVQPMDIAALQQGLQELGYVEGQNLTIEVRYADGDAAKLPGLAANCTISRWTCSSWTGARHWWRSARLSGLHRSAAVSNREIYYMLTSASCWKSNCDSSLNGPGKLVMITS